MFKCMYIPVMLFYTKLRKYLPASYYLPWLCAALTHFLPKIMYENLTLIKGIYI